MTQAELAKKLDVSDKAISKWENGQAFPRIETFENLAAVLDTTAGEIFSASSDGVRRICVVNDIYEIMHFDVNGQLYSIRADESKWIEVKSDTMIVKVTGELLTDDTFEELDGIDYSLKDKLMMKLAKKLTTEFLSLVLQVDCTYKISDIVSESIIKFEPDSFDLGDKTLIYQDFQIMYPKVVCDDSMQVELLHAKGKNSKAIIKKYKRLGLASDFGLDFITMIISYPLRGLYFKHLCKPYVLKKNIINVEKHKQKTEKRNSGKKLGCLGSFLTAIVFIILFLILDNFVFNVIFVAKDKPYLVAADYSTITCADDVYVRIDELPEEAKESGFFGASMWEDARTDGLSKFDQSAQDSKVKLYEDDEGREYLWLVENYFDEVLSPDKDYEDFDEHYVYVLEEQK